jgi:hypothetical protein
MRVSIIPCVRNSDYRLGVSLGVPAFSGRALAFGWASLRCPIGFAASIPDAITEGE